MSRPYTSAPQVDIIIDDGSNLRLYVKSLEWKSFINSGYIVRIRLFDAWLNRLQGLMRDKILNDARSKPTKLKFRLVYDDRDDSRTNYVTAYITDIGANGVLRDNVLEFIAIDPPTWILNAGGSDGKAYKGKISNVVKQVVAEYSKDIGNIDVEMSETNDNSTNIWWMMRMDPKTFIMSLLEWSSPTTDSKSNWVVASKDEKIIIRQHDELIASATNLGDFIIGSNDLGENNQDKYIKSYELLSNNFISVTQSKLITSGISSVTGQYIDKIINPKVATVDDSNTNNKVNTSISRDQGFKKSEKDWSTHIISIPEFSGGELGINYNDYIDGYARNLYINMLRMVMRMRITIIGHQGIDDSSKIGGMKLKIIANNLDQEPYFFSGDWIVYGFHHKYTHGGGWLTDLYIYRIDYNSTAKEV